MCVDGPMMEGGSLQNGDPRGIQDGNTVKGYLTRIVHLERGETSKRESPVSSFLLLIIGSTRPHHPGAA